MEANWGKEKYQYYYTDYVDKDYPSKLTRKEEQLAEIEQEEAIKSQKRILSTLDDVDLEVYEDGDSQGFIEYLEEQNRLVSSDTGRTKKRRHVQFEEADDASDGINEDNEQEDEEDEEEDEEEEEQSDNGRKRRPINMAIKKNRGLTPYKKKEYRNPRVKHKLKYRKAMIKRRRNVKEAQFEHHRYSGESTGIKTSTVKSIKLC